MKPFEYSIKLPANFVLKIKLYDFPGDKTSDFMYCSICSSSVTASLLSTTSISEINISVNNGAIYCPAGNIDENQLLVLHVI